MYVPDELRKPRGKVLAATGILLAIWGVVNLLEEDSPPRQSPPISVQAHVTACDVKSEWLTGYRHQTRYLVSARYRAATGGKGPAHRIVQQRRFDYESEATAMCASLPQGTTVTLVLDELDPLSVAEPPYEHTASDRMTWSIMAFLAAGVFLKISTKPST